MSFSEDIKNAILNNEQELVNDKKQELLKHIKSHSFVIKAVLNEEGIKITLREEVVENPDRVAEAFIFGGQLRKKKSVGKDKIDANDYYFVNKFKG